jgi:hypothetical protein
MHQLLALDGVGRYDSIVDDNARTEGKCQWVMADLRQTWEHAVLSQD